MEKSNYVERTEFIETISEIHLKVNEINQNVKGLKNDMTDVVELSKRLKRLLVESNGRESIVDTIRRHDRELEEVVKYVDQQKQEAFNKWKMISDTFWKYLIRVVVVGALGGFIALLAEHSTIINQILKEVLK